MARDTEAGSFTVQKHELKVTVLPHEEPKVQALLQGVNPVGRKVYFYDTPDLVLCRKDLFLRARVTERDKDDSTVKLRPLPDTVPARWLATRKVRFEVDVIGDRQVPSAKLDSTPERGRIEQVEQGTLEPRKLFDDAQEALIEDEVPLEDLAVLGPVTARKWDLRVDDFPYEFSVEEWSLDDLHFLELSFKVDPEEGESAKRAFHSLLTRLGIGPDGDPDPKTARVIERLAERLPRKNP